MRFLKSTVNHYEDIGKLVFAKTIKCSRCGYELEVGNMMYPFLSLNDDTEITHSEMLSDGRVKVYIETPDLKDGFHNATCYLPEYLWENVCGYSDDEMKYFKQLVRNNAHLILEFSQVGGVLNAANF